MDESWVLGMIGVSGVSRAKGVSGENRDQEHQLMQKKYTIQIITGSEKSFSYKD